MRLRDADDSAIADLERLKEFILPHNKKVLLDVSKYEDLLDRLELLQEIQLAEQQLADGKGVERGEALQQILADMYKS